MKRSEMIKKIVESIELHNGNDPSWLEYPEAKRSKEIAYDVAHKLLQDLEELGMNPPRHAPDDAGLVWGDEKTGEPNGFKIMVSKWEPEDE